MRRVTILGRGGAGKSTLARSIGAVTGLPVVELDALYWQRGRTTMTPAQWVAHQRDLVQPGAWILDGDLGPYDEALDIRLRAADTVIVLDFAFPRCAWRTLRRGRERFDYWRWIWGYRRHSLPRVMQAITTDAAHARVQVLRNPGMVRRFLAELRTTAGNDAGADT